MRNTNLEIMSWGGHSYSIGRIYNPNYYKFEVGKYTSIAVGLQLFTTIHPKDMISNYPFRELKKWDYPLCERKEPIIIGNDVWIGANVGIVNKVTVGDGAIVGAYTVISKDIPPYAVVVGNPPRIIRYRFNKDQIKKLLKIKWWDWTDEKMEERKDDFKLKIDDFIKKYD